MSTGPCPDSATSTRVSTAARSPTSQATPRAGTPASSTFAAAWCAHSPSRSPIVTPRTPSSAKRSASARPMPLPPPVTTTDLPSPCMADFLRFGHELDAGVQQPLASSGRASSHGTNQVYCRPISNNDVRSDQRTAEAPPPAEGAARPPAGAPPPEKVPNDVQPFSNRGGTVAVLPPCPRHADAERGADT